MPAGGRWDLLTDPDAALMQADLNAARAATVASEAERRWQEKKEEAHQKELARQERERKRAKADQETAAKRAKIDAEIEQSK